jgi:hypothetical protein
MDALAESPWTSLVRRIAALAVDIALVALPASTVVVVVQAVVLVVVNTLNPSSSLDGVPAVTVRPESTPDRHRCSRDSLSLPLLLRRRRWIQTVGSWRSGSPKLRVLS